MATLAQRIFSLNVDDNIFLACEEMAVSTFHEADTGTNFYTFKDDSRIKINKSGEASVIDHGQKLVDVKRFMVVENGMHRTRQESELHARQRAKEKPGRCFLVVEVKSSYETPSEPVKKIISE